MGHPPDAPQVWHAGLFCEKKWSCYHCCAQKDFISSLISFTGNKKLIVCVCFVNAISNSQRKRKLRKVNRNAEHEHFVMMMGSSAGFWWTAFCPMGWFWPWSVSVRPRSSPSNMSCLRRPENILSITSYRKRHPTSSSALHRWELSLSWISKLSKSVFQFCENYRGNPLCFNWMVLQEKINIHLYSRPLNTFVLFWTIHFTPIERLLATTTVHC